MPDSLWQPMREPLFQKMLRATFYALGGEKDEPFQFHWPTPQQLQTYEHRRKRNARRHGKNSPESNRAAQVRYRLRHAEQHRVRHAEEERRRRRTPDGIRHEQRRQQLRFEDAERQRRRRIHEATDLLTHALKDLEAPTYLIQRNGQTEREHWPLHDAAALWLATNAGDTTNK